MSSAGGAGGVRGASFTITWVHWFVRSRRISYERLGHRTRPQVIVAKRITTTIIQCSESNEISWVTHLPENRSPSASNPRSRAGIRKGELNRAVGAFEHWITWIDGYVHNYGSKRRARNTCQPGEGEKAHYSLFRL